MCELLGEAHRTFEILAAGISGALAGPVPDGEVMHALCRYAETRYAELRRLSDQPAEDLSN